MEPIVTKCFEEFKLGQTHKSAMSTIDNNANVEGCKKEFQILKNSPDWKKSRPRILSASSEKSRPILIADTYDEIC